VTRGLFASVSALANAIYLALMAPAHLFRLTDEGTSR
jgi:hypothetical protein